MGEGGDNMTNYELLKDVNGLDDILRSIKYHRKWSIVTPKGVEEEVGIAEKVEYHYGDGMRGLISALYNLILNMEQ